MNNKEDNSVTIVYLFTKEDGVIKPHSIPSIGLKFIPHKGDFYRDYPTNDLYEVSLVIITDLDVRVLLNKLSNPERFSEMMKHY